MNFCVFPFSVFPCRWPVVSKDKPYWGQCRVLPTVTDWSTIRSCLYLVSVIKSMVHGYLSPKFRQEFGEMNITGLYSVSELKSQEKNFWASIHMSSLNFNNGNPQTTLLSHLIL